MNRKADYSKNAGMTLVELLVAVTMLAIIVVPLLHSMASSARVGLKARQNLRVTTVAQDIMEGIKAESIESLSCSFNYPDDVYSELNHVPITVEANSFHNFFVVKPILIDGKNSSKIFELRANVVESESSAGYRSVSNLIDISASRNTNMGGFADPDPSIADAAASTKKTDDAMGYEFYSKSNNIYYFAIQDMNIENTVGDPNFKVDAFIELDGSNYTSTGLDPKQSIDPSKDEVLLNEQGRINYSATDEKRDAFFIEDESLGRFTAQEFNTTYRPSIDCQPKDLSKEIVIETVNKSAQPGGDKATDGVSDWIVVTCKITYTSSDAYLIPTTHENYDPIKGGNQHYEKSYEYTIFDNKATGYALENIYICFYPGYGNASKDQFVYVNADSVPATLHLIKQERENNGTLNSDELHYSCVVTVNEGLGAAIDHVGTGARDDSVTDIRTNLDSNMYKIYMPTAPDVRQATYYYNGTVVNRNFANPRENRIFALGGEESVNGQIYDVTIDIYREGTLNKALSTGNVDKKDILFTLKGSMK